MRFKVLTEENMKTVVFWAVIPFIILRTIVSDEHVSVFRMQGRGRH
jgi:hypothetical protein